MAENALRTFVVGVGEAIKNKKGISVPLSPMKFAEEISSIEIGYSQEEVDELADLIGGEITD